MTELTKVTLSYEEAFLAGAEVAGGKGWNLGRLHRFGFPVPRGGVIAAHIYRQIIQSERIAQRIAALTEVTGQEIESEAVTEHLDELRAAIVTTPVPDVVRVAVQALLDD